MATLCCIGDNGSNECGIPDGDDAAKSLGVFTLCGWSKAQQVIAVTVGSGYNIYTVKSKRNELLCCGFIRGVQQHFPFKKNPFYIIPDQVSILCSQYLYLQHLKEYWAAGTNKYGQCGVESDEEEIIFSRIEGLSNILKVKCGVVGNSTLWIKHDGSLYINGSNAMGQLATGDTDDINIPTLSTFTEQHSELRVVDGASSSFFTVLVTDNGSAWFSGEFEAGAWGGCLDTNSKFIQLKVPRNDVCILSVSAGSEHILFVAQNGSVLTFGNEGHDYFTKQHSRLELIPFFDKNNIKIQSVCCGQNHCLALSSDGKVYGWGRDDCGQCGVGNKYMVRTPKLVDIELNVASKRIECGNYHSGLITMDNEVYLWGNNANNECCANAENEKVQKVYSPRNVTDYVLSQSKTNRIINFYLGTYTTLFLLD